MDKILKVRDFFINKKIDDSTLENVIIECSKIASGGVSNARLREKIEHVIKKYLTMKGYKINWVECNENNNPPEVVDSNKIVVYISEFIAQGNSVIHKIIL